MKKRFDRHLDNLENVFTFISGFVNKYQLDEGIAYSLNLALEELFTNMVKYHPHNPHKILISLEIDNDNLVTSITDFDVDRFNIEEQKVYDLKMPIKNRPIGKLGIYLVKQLMDEVRYRYADRNSTIILVKKLRNTYV
jgi:anti-sigma regulatory factor (Ser/Thr protein kinase)